MTAAVPDPRFRDHLAEALIEARLVRWREPELAREYVDALMPTIAAEVEARVQAAANQRAAEGVTPTEIANYFRGYGIHDELILGYLVRRAAALASPATAPRAEERQADVMPDGWIDADWTHYS